MWDVVNQLCDIMRCNARFESYSGTSGQQHTEEGFLQIFRVYKWVGLNFNFVPSIYCELQHRASVSCIIKFGSSFLFYLSKNQMPTISNLKTKRSVRTSSRSSLLVYCILPVNGRSLHSPASISHSYCIMKLYLYRGLDGEIVPKDVTHVIVDDKVTIIKEKAFYECGHLVSIMMGDNVKVSGVVMPFDSFDTQSITEGRILFYGSKSVLARQIVRILLKIPFK